MLSMIERGENDRVVKTDQESRKRIVKRVEIREKDR
jgi:hypothetical protein